MSNQPPLLTSSQFERYQRQIRLTEVGIEGQKKLQDAKVLLVGAGALGSPSAIYLATAGVGTIGVVDGDRVELSNLHRQVIHASSNVKRLKTESAKIHLQALNPEIDVIEHPVYLTSENARTLIQPYDLVINGTDNFPTRYLINDACVLLRKPLIDASILRFNGQATVYMPGSGCYRCLFPSPPAPGSVPSCAEAGVIGALAGHMGTLQALEAIKIILGVGASLAGKLLLFDALEGRHRTVRYSRDRKCPVCGDQPVITSLVDYEAFCSQSEQTKTSVETVEELGWVVTAEQVWRQQTECSIQLLDVRESSEYERSHLRGSKLIPLDQLKDHIHHFNTADTLYIICQSGNRSASATLLLRQAGFERVFSLQGGILGWMNQQLPLESITTHP